MKELANKVLQLPIMRRDSIITPSSINVQDRTFDLRWTTGARRITWSWEEGDWGGFIEEELDLAGADLSRLNNGAPYFKDHASWSIDNQLGVHVDGSAIIDLQAKEGRAKIRFSKNAWCQRYWDDIVDTILRQTSVGYQVGTYLVIREEGRLPLYRAIQWTPLENSQVGIAADPGAGVIRSAGSEPPKLFGTSIVYQKRTVISVPKEVTTMKNKPKIPNQKRTLTADQTTQLKDILAKHMLPAENVDACVADIEAMLPADLATETASGSGTQSADLTAIAKELGCKENATPKELASAAKNLRTLCDSLEEQLEEGDEDSEFDANEAKGLHRELNKVSKDFARELFDGNTELYRSKVAKVKAITGNPPAAKPETRKNLASHESDSADDLLAKEIETEEKRLMELNPKLTPSAAYKRAFENVKAKKNIKAPAA